MSIPQLPDISEVEPLTDADQPLIDDVIAVLKKHGAIDRFGLCLLHQHFPVEHESEILVESTDQETRTQTIKPVPKDELAGLDYTVTSWRLDSGHAMMACVCVNFGKIGHVHVSRG